jgi:hypothetical protein
MKINEVENMQNIDKYGILTISADYGFNFLQYLPIDINEED